MGVLLSIIIILASVLLIAIVFIQNPKGGGLSTDFGAAHQIGGVKQTTDFIDKATWVLAAVVMVTSIALSIQSKPKSNLPQQQTEQPANGGQPEQPQQPQ